MRSGSSGGALPDRSTSPPRPAVDRSASYAVSMSRSRWLSRSLPESVIVRATRTHPGHFVWSCTAWKDARSQQRDQLDASCLELVLRRVRVVAADDLDQSGPEVPLRVAELLVDVPRLEAEPLGDLTGRQPLLEAQVEDLDAVASFGAAIDPFRHPQPRAARDHLDPRTVEHARQRRLGVRERVEAGAARLLRHPPHAVRALDAVRDVADDGVQVRTEPCRPRGIDAPQRAVRLEALHEHLLRAVVDGLVHARHTPARREVRADHRAIR